MNLAVRIFKSQVSDFVCLTKDFKAEINKIAQIIADFERERLASRDEYIQHLCNAASALGKPLDAAKLPAWIMLKSVP